MDHIVNRKDLGIYIFYISMLFLLVLFGGVVALIVKESIFPEANRKEFILTIIQASVLFASLLITSKYVKKENSKFAIFYDKAKSLVRLVCIILFIVIMYFIAQLIEAILFIIL